jgi:putative (di)nucleoside polyphosphate hydrolase
VSIKKYRDNICAVIRDTTGNSVLIFHRKGLPTDTGWQFPQGGIDSKKDLIEELKRELREEIGTDAISIIKVSPNTYTYDFPDDIPVKHSGYCGQRQRWVLVELDCDESDISFKGRYAEFDDYRWVSPQEAVSEVIDFKKDVYKRALSDLTLI